MRRSLCIHRPSSHCLSQPVLHQESVLIRSSISVRTIVLAILTGIAPVALSTPALCQDDIFGDGGFGSSNLSTPVAGGTDLGTNTRNSSGSTTRLEFSRNPVVLSLRDKPPRRPAEYARAFLYLSRIGQWNELARYLDQLAASPPTPATASEMLSEIGSAEWLKIIRNAESLSIEQRAYLQSVVDVARQAGASPSILQRFADLLRDPRASEKRRGIMGLQSAGNAGLQFLVEQVMTSDREPSVAYAAYIHSMGNAGDEAIHAALVQASPQERQRLVSLLVQIPGKDYVRTLATIAHSSLDTQESQSLATQAVIRELGALPTAEQVASFLDQQMNDELLALEAAQHESVSQIKIIWQFNRDQGLQFTEQNDVAFLLNRAGIYAHQRMSVAKEVGTDSSLAAAVLLESHYRQFPSYSLDTPLEALGVLPQHIRDSNEFLALVWDTGLKHQLHAAVLRCTQQMAEWVREGRTDPLIHDRLEQGLMHGLPIVRFASLQCRFQEEYLLPSPLESKANTVLQEAVTLDARPRALIVGADPFLRDHLGDLLSQALIASTQAQTAQEAIALIVSPQPFEQIFILDQLPGMTISQLVQRLQHPYRGSMLPIHIMADDLKDSEVQLLSKSPNVLFGNNPRTIASLTIQLDQAQRKLHSPTLTPTDRSIIHDQALEFAEKLALNQSDGNRQLISKLAKIVPLKTPESSLRNLSNAKLLESNSVEAQRELLRRVVANEGKPAQRIDAAQMLATLVRRQSLKLPTSELADLYEIYNLRAQDELVTRQALTILLDTLDVYFK